jgi:hypothetical protein
MRAKERINRGMVMASSAKAGVQSPAALAWGFREEAKGRTPNDRCGKPRATTYDVHPGSSAGSRSLRCPAVVLRPYRVVPW